MNADRFEAITQQYERLRVGVVGDFCLDRYLEIDSARAETSIETGLPVFNVMRTRAQPGGAGTVMNNLVALGVRTVFPVGFAGDDGEGYELRRALAVLPGARMDYFLQTADRQTFTYCKPLVCEPGKPPRELNRLDKKNWTPTPRAVSEQLAASVTSLARKVDALILLEQVDQPETGVLTEAVLSVVERLATSHPQLLILADSRCSLRRFPPVVFKMNAAELAALTGTVAAPDDAVVSKAALTLAKNNSHPVIVTRAERGMLGALPSGEVKQVPALPVRGEIDVVGAGDAVTANLTLALAAGATLHEALELANTAGSIVIHQLGTTGAASVVQLRERLFANSIAPTGNAG
jgi:rfaE bifunctional protein kinase chain/domain